MSALGSCAHELLCSNNTSVLSVIQIHQSGPCYLGHDYGASFILKVLLSLHSPVTYLPGRTDCFLLCNSWNMLIFLAKLLKGSVHDGCICISPVSIPVPAAKVPSRCLVTEWYLLFIDFSRMSEHPRVCKIISFSLSPHNYWVYLLCVRHCSGCWGYKCILKCK